MWICSYCETINEDGGSCICCGKEKQIILLPNKTVENIAHESAHTRRSEKKKAGKVFLRFIPWVLVCVLTALLIADVVFDVNLKKITELGSAFENVFASEKHTKEVHIWQNATYDSPERCAICGKTQGNVKGYVGKVQGSYVPSKQANAKLGYWRVPAYEFDAPIEKCRKITIWLSLDNITSGSPYGDWDFYVRSTDGQWINVATVDVQRNTTSCDVCFSTPIDIEAVACTRMSTEPCDHSMRYSVSDAQVFVN